MDVKTTFRNLVRDQSVSICMLQVSSSFFVLRAGLLFYLYSESKSLLLSLLRQKVSPSISIQDANPHFYLFQKASLLFFLYSDRKSPHLSLFRTQTSTSTSCIKPVFSSISILITILYFYYHFSFRNKFFFSPV